jgi:hypothetical protein
MARGGEEILLLAVSKAKELIMLISARNFATNLMIRRPFSKSLTSTEVEPEQHAPNRAMLMLAKEVISREPAKHRKIRRQLDGE